MRQAAIRLDDTGADAGGRVQLRFQSVTVPEEKPARVAIAFRRDDAAAPWLGPQGWQTTGHLFDPAEVWLEGDDLVLEVDRSVVAHIPPFHVVEVQLPVLDLCGSLSWADVTPSHVPAAATPPAPAAPSSMAKPPPATVRKLAFEATPERRIVFRPIGTGSSPVPASLEPGGTFGGLAFAELARAFNGTLEIGDGGQARITASGPEAAPRQIRFQVAPDGSIALHRPSGPGADPALLTQPGPDGGPVFGIPRERLQAVGKGTLRLEAATLTAELDAEVPPPWWQRASATSVAAGLAALLVLAIFTFGYAVFRDEPPITEAPRTAQSSVESGPVESGPVESGPVEPVPVEPVPVEPVPVEPPAAVPLELPPPVALERDEPPGRIEPAPLPADRAESLPQELEAPEPEVGAGDPPRDIAAGPRALPSPPEPATPEPPTPEPPTAEPPTLEPRVEAPPAALPASPAPAPRATVETQSAPEQPLPPQPEPPVAVEREPPPADAAPDLPAEAAPEPPAEAAPEPPLAGLQAVPSPRAEPPAAEPPVAESPAAEPPVAEPPFAEPPPLAALDPAPADPLDQLLPPGRGSGHKLLARLAATESSEGCDGRQLPYFRVIETDVEPARLPPGGRFSHRLVYALCPAGPDSQSAATVTRELRGSTDVLLADTANGFQLRPGTWASDEELAVPPNTDPGRYTVNTTVTFNDRVWTEQADLLIE